jgi:hypothetical protein
LHLQRVIELDPDHADARRALKYFFRDGHWAGPVQRSIDDAAEGSNSQRAGSAP